MCKGHTCMVGFWPARILGILLLTKGAQESGVGGFLSPNMWLDLKIQLPGFFCLLVSMSASVYPGNVQQDAPLHSVRSVGGSGSCLPLPKSADLEPAWPQGLLRLLSLILCLYPSFHPFSVLMDKRLAGCGCGLSHWLQPHKCRCYPKYSEATVSLWFPLDTATSNVGSQVAEVKETVPAGAGILPRVNHLQIWDPRAHEPHLQVMLTSFQHSKYGLLSLMKLLIRCFQVRQRILNASIFTLTWPLFCWQYLLATISHDNRKKTTKDPQKDALPKQAWQTLKTCWRK